MSEFKPVGHRFPCLQCALNQHEHSDILIVHDMHGWAPGDYPADKKPIIGTLRMIKDFSVQLSFAVDAAAMLGTR